MKIAIMQPYFLPYLGYFQLISAVDSFVVYDTIQYTKKGWINRNQMLRNGAAVMVSLPVKKGSDYLDVVDRKLADDFDPKALQNQIAGAYRMAPYFSSTMPLIESILQYRSANLFDFLFHSLRQCCEHLNIATPLMRSSAVEKGPSLLKGQDRVIDICRRLSGDVYINPPGGRALYAAKDFKAERLALQFIRPRLRSYPQIGAGFVPSLSILDVMMFNRPDHINGTLLKDFDLGD
jgi:hypothetical protein